MFYYLDYDYDVSCHIIQSHVIKLYVFDQTNTQCMRYKAVQKIEMKI